MAKKAKTTKFAEESAALSGETATDNALVPAKGPSAAMIALFRDNDNLLGNLKIERRNLPTMIKPADVPTGGVVIGEVIKVIDSPVTTVKGKLLWLRLRDRSEWLFPATGVVRNALCPGVDGSKELQAALEKEIGKVIILKKTGTKPSKYKREMFLFDVFTSPVPKDFYLAPEPASV